MRVRVHPFSRRREGNLLGLLDIIALCSSPCFSCFLCRLPLSWFAPYLDLNLVGSCCNVLSKQLLTSEKVYLVLESRREEKEGEGGKKNKTIIYADPYLTLIRVAYYRLQFLHPVKQITYVLLARE